MSLLDYRNKFPEYDDIPDDLLVQGLYKKYGEAESPEGFAEKLGYQGVISVPEPEREPDLQIAAPFKEGVKDVARNVVSASLGSEQARDTAEEAKRFGQPQLQSLMTPGMMQEVAQGQTAGISPEQALETSRQGRIADLSQTVEGLAPDESYQRSEGWRGWVEDFVRTAPQIGTQIGATILAGPAGGVGMMGSQIMGSTYENLVSEGVEPKRAIHAGLANAVVQAPLEQIGINKIAKIWKPQKHILQKLKNIGAAAGTEWLTEFVQAYPDMMINTIAQNPDMGKVDQFKGMVDQLWETTKQGAYEGTLTAPWALLGIAAPIDATITKDDADKIFKDSDKDEVPETEFPQSVNKNLIAQKAQALTAIPMLPPGGQFEIENLQRDKAKRVANQNTIDQQDLQTEDAVNNEIIRNEIARQKLTQRAEQRKPGPEIIGDGKNLKSVLAKGVLKKIKEVDPGLNLTEPEALDFYENSSSDFQSAMDRISFKSWAKQVKGEDVEKPPTPSENLTSAIESIIDQTLTARGVPREKTPQQVRPDIAQGEVQESVKPEIPPTPTKPEITSGEKTQKRLAKNDRGTEITKKAAELEKALSVHKPWEMSRDENWQSFLDSRPKQPWNGEPSLPSRPSNLNALAKKVYVGHRTSVKQAIKEGKIESHPDYPELTQKPKTKKPAKLAIKVGSKFKLPNGEIIEIKREFKENGNEDWVEFNRSGGGAQQGKNENSVKSLRQFLTNWKATYEKPTTTKKVAVKPAEKPKTVEPKVESNEIITSYRKELKDRGIESMLEIDPESKDWDVLSRLQENQGNEVIKQYRKRHPKGPIVLSGKGGTHGVLIHKSTKEPGRYQITSWDERGFSGDTSEATEAKAVKEAYRGTVRHFGKEQFDGISKTDKFFQGIEDSRKVERWNKEHWERSQERKLPANQKEELLSEIDDAIKLFDDGLSQEDGEIGWYKFKVGNAEYAVVGPELKTFKDSVKKQFPVRPSNIRKTKPTLSKGQNLKSKEKRFAKRFPDLSKISEEDIDKFVPLSKSDNYKDKILANVKRADFLNWLLNQKIKSEFKKGILENLKTESGEAQIINDLSAYGADLIKQGHNTYSKFRNEMKRQFAEVWDKIKNLIRKAFKSAKDIVANEKGQSGMWKDAFNKFQKFRAENPNATKTEIQKATGLSGYQVDNLSTLQDAQGSPDILGKKTVTFEESQAPLTEQDLIDNRESTKRVKTIAGQALSVAVSDIKGEVSRLLAPISTRLARINEKISTKVRRLEFDIGTKSGKEVEAILPLLKKTKKMNRNDAADWDYARKNSWAEVTDRLVKKYDMEKEYASARGVLDKLRKEAVDTGLEVRKIEDYWPRRLKDHRGFLRAMGKEMDGFNDIYSRAIQDKAIELEMSVSDMDTDMKANIISNIILGGPTGLAGMSSAKKRKLKKIPARLNKFYLNSDAAIIEHIYEVRSQIEKRRFFGKIPKKVAEHRRKLQAAQKKIKELNKQLDLEPGRLEVKDDDVKKKRNKLIGRAKQHQAYINKYAKQRDYTANIGAYVDELMNEGAIDPNKQSELNDILKARFHQRGAHGFFKLYKNFSYIDTMGSPISALTQIGDSAWTLYNAGLLKGLKNIAKASPPKKYKNVKITREDVGVTHIAQEFADPGTLGKALALVFKATGLEKIDAVGKESLLNASLEKYQKQAKENPKKLSSEIRKMFEGETQSVIDDLVSGKISDNVKFLAYSRLLDFQPMALSEMPQRYLTSGNGRIFYMLKTFTIKQFDVFRNETFHKIRTGNKAEKIQGIKNFVRLSMFFVLANATADELKDWMLGRKTDLGDRVVDNILRLAGSSKFITWKARTEGAGSAMARQVLPPFKFIDSATKDIYNAGDDKGLEITSSIPLLGKLAYWHMGRGVSKRGDLWNRRLSREKSKLKKIEEGLETTTDKKSYISKNRESLQRLRKLNAVQGRLNMYQKRINRLEKIGGRKAEIEKLRKARSDLIKKTLK